MKREISMFLQRMGDNPKHRIVDFLLEKIGLDYTKTEIARYAGISRPTLYATWPEIMKQKIVKSTRKIGKAMLFTFDRESEAGRFYFEIEKMLLKESFAEAEAMAKQKVVA